MYYNVAKKGSATLSEPNAAEAALVRELAALRKRIASLEQDAKSLERLLIRLRRSNAHANEPGRSDSANRIIVEQAILTALSGSDRNYLRTSELRDIANAAAFELNDATFRSHLFRLKEKGRIESAGYGRWRLSENNDSNRPLKS